MLSSADGKCHQGAGERNQSRKLGWKLTSRQLESVYLMADPESQTPWWWAWSASVAPYAVLLQLLVNNRISGDEFETLFLPLYKGDPTKWPQEIFVILDQLFYAVDDYNRDPELRDNDVDGNELKSRASLALAQLGKLAVNPGPNV